ncbi:acyl-CoA carboxylase subunit epsilon [Arthrobacter sp. Sr33]
MTLAPDQTRRDADDDGTPAEPTLQVIRGTPTAEELAALTAVVVALSENSTEPNAATPHRTWARRDHLRLAPRPGPGSWRRSVR